MKSLILSTLLTISAPLWAGESATASNEGNTEEQSETVDENLATPDEIGMEERAALAATPLKLANARATLAYHLRGLRHNVAVQKAYIAKSYVYVTQRSGDTCYLSRLRINGNTATFVDQMTLTNTGHCQTLDMYAYRGLNYFYFSSKSDPSTPKNWSLQVARMQYRAGARYDYTSLRRFTYLNYANNNDMRLGTTKRVDGGGNSSHTIFRVETKEGTVSWSVYDTVALNQLLDSDEQVRLDSPEAQAACVGSFTQRGSEIVRPNASFQGLDMLGSSEIYTSGGAEGETPQIAKMHSSGVYQSLVRITNVGTHEIEGLQTKNGQVYFTIVTDPVNKTNTQKIYYVPEAIF